MTENEQTELDPKLEAQIDKEIKDHGKCQTFWPDVYRKLRREGYLPERIDYDMSHMWR